MSEQSRVEIAFISKEIGIAEVVIRKSGKTSFAVFMDDKVVYKKQIDLLDGSTIVPISENSGVIKNKFVSLPPEPIDYDNEEQLYEELLVFISKYFEVTKSFREVAALYIMLTWVYERFNELPYLRVIGTLGTGKSRFLKVMAACSYHPMMLGSSSVAAMFRTIDKFKGTFILDEADFRSSEFSSDVAKILNNGHSKGMPVARMRGNTKGEFITDIFEVYGPKILASRESFNDAALESRCFMQRLYPNSKIKAPISIGEEFEQEAILLKGKLLMFRFRNLSKIEIKELARGDIKNLRVLQVVQPLWNIARLVNNLVASQISEQADEMDENLISNQADTQEADVLISILKLLETGKERLHMKDIADTYNKRFGMRSETNEDGSMNAYDHKLNLSGRKVGEIVGKVLHLKKFKDNHGVYINKDKYTLKILSMLRERYGVTDDLI